MHPVVVRYTAAPGHADRLRDLVTQHWPTLYAKGLTTDRPAVVIAVNRQPGVLIEVYEWRSPEAVHTAHEHPRVRALWDEMERVGKVEPWDGTYVVAPGP
jgi:hypothetical protein